MSSVLKPFARARRNDGTGAHADVAMQRREIEPLGALGERVQGAELIERSQRSAASKCEADTAAAGALSDGGFDA